MENKVMQLRIGNRVLQKSAVMVVLIACMSVYADDPARTDSTTATPATTPSSTVQTSTSTTPSVNRSDANFIKEAAKGNQIEVKLGQLAADKSQNAEIKHFGERLVKDHTSANDELTRIAQAKGVDLTKEMDRAGTVATKDVDKFSNKTGADFDKAYIKHMVTDHKKDISKFEKEATQSNDPDVKAFAQKTLPTLREHLRMAEDIARTLGVDTAAYSTSSDTSAAGAGGTVSTERGTSNPNVDNRTGTDKSSQGSISTSDNNTYASSQTETKPKTKLFSTDKNDGKLWGIFPWHHKNREAGANVSVDTQGGTVSAQSSGSAAGSAPSSSSGSSSDNTQK